MSLSNNNGISLQDSLYLKNYMILKFSPTQISMEFKYKINSHKNTSAKKEFPEDLLNSICSLRNISHTSCAFKSLRIMKTTRDSK